MSYRQARNFCEMMRSLGYNRIISIENFRKPNFKLVAEILYWFINRFDPKADIPDDVSDDKDRVEFICAAGKFFYSHLKVKLNLKKLYTSDNSCLPELLKIAEIFFNAKNTIINSDDIEFTGELDISSKNKEIKELRDLSSSIVDTGLSLLDKEKVLKNQREKALEFLDNLTQGGESKKEKEQIEKRVISILQGQIDTIEQLDTHINQLKQKEAQLDEDIKTKSLACERAEKRLEGIQGVRPKADSELIQLETELQHFYRLYVEKLRNHDYMEQKLEEFNNIQRLKEEIEHNELKDLKMKNAEKMKENYFDKGIVFGKDEEENEDDQGDVNDIEYNYNDVKNSNKMKNNFRDQTNTRGGQRGNARQINDEEEDDENFGVEEEDEENEDDERF